jgi:CheY-like chemotaxis protein
MNIMTEVVYKKVLVAEDSSVIQNLLKKILLFENCKITSAKNGEAVLDKFESEDYDLVIMDINLPLLDGLSATKQIRSGKTKKANIPIIGISGNAKNLPVSEFFEAGMNEYMQKPLDYDKLIELVKKYTDKH